MMNSQSLIKSRASYCKSLFKRGITKELGMINRAINCWKDLVKDPKIQAYKKYVCGMSDTIISMAKNFTNCIYNVVDCVDTLVNVSVSIEPCFYYSFSALRTRILHSRNYIKQTELN